MRRARHGLRRVLERQPDVHRRARAAIGKPTRVVGRGQDLEDPEVRPALHDSDNRELTVVEPDRTAHGRRVAAECPRPETVADHDSRRTAGARLLCREPAPREWTHAEHRQQPIGHPKRLQPDRLTLLGGVVHLDGVKRRDLFHALAALLEVKEVGQRRRLARGAGVSIGLPDDRERVDVLHRRRPQQHGIDNAEDRRVGADPKRHRQQCHDREAWVADEDAEGIPKILTKHGALS